MAMFKLVRTCYACPEQYDVYCKEKKVGYIRYRSGKFTVEYPDCGKELLTALHIGDEYDGMFSDDTDRYMYLDIAVIAIAEKLGIEDDSYIVVDDERYNIDKK